MEAITEFYRRFIYACLREDASEIDRTLNDNAWSWEDFLRISAEEGLLPLISWQFERLRIEPRIPSEITELLQATLRLNRERNEKILHTLLEAALLLNASGIEPVLLKGTALLIAGIYENPAIRYLADIDVLVPARQCPQAAEVLIQNGWHEDTRDPFRHFRHHRPPLRSPTSGVWLELHHSIGTGPCEYILPASGVIRGSAAKVVEGAIVRIPRHDDLLTHIILHSQIQHSSYNRVWPPIRGIHDLIVLSARSGAALNWEAVRSRFSRARQGKTFWLHLLEIKEATGFMPGLEAPDSFCLTLARKRRRLLQRKPPLRYLDPVFMLQMTLGRRLTTARRMLRTTPGILQLAKQVTAKETYSRIWIDFSRGRGR